ncbi:cysteine-rich CWC family protein [Cupriavidus consociatus]|uniref:cysteine-rich CWC family protein n=1 Tax=Cupriavidus consociatus TaxID=2821357 RepID=UPI001AEAC903|nr:MULTISPECIES: cysteine-rich CWC family protein [unclassified Cupriavidus]MBP0624511.1 cysteine-rich CWC family protein [Cupriavidus sp. LEh25]MDK2661223.1 cysteine-rich CWC family protein [Cupriavidus sp. LEh21]
MTDPATVLTGQLRPVEHCSQCGAGFVCGYVAGLSECWCASQPLLPARRIVPGQHCLCPNCLAARQRGDQAPEPAEG